MAKVKICGVTTPEALEAAREADWIGLVFFERSPRWIAPADAAALLDGEAGQGGGARVGLFVEPTDEAVALVLSQVRLDALQLYASEARVAALRARFGLPAWRAVGVSGLGDLPGETAADALVVEPRPPAGSDRPGGNAVSMDPGLTRGWAAPVPWLLAGGLTPDTVAEAIERSGAAAVDVSSGVERQRGIKDPALVERFIAAARGAGRQPA